MARLALLANRWFLRNKANKWFCVSCETWNRVSIRRIRHQPPLGGLVFYMLAQAFLDHLKNTQEQKNSSLKKITQNSGKKLKASAKFEKRHQKLTQIKGENQGNYTIMANGYNMAKTST